MTHEEREALTDAERLAHAVLMFYQVDRWDFEARQDWFNLTQQTEATTRILCDYAKTFIREEQKKAV